MSDLSAFYGLKGREDRVRSGLDHRDRAATAFVLPQNGSHSVAICSSSSRSRSRSAMNRACNSCSESSTALASVVSCPMAWRPSISARCLWRSTSVRATRSSARASILGTSRVTAPTVPSRDNGRCRTFLGFCQLQRRSPAGKGVCRCRNFPSFSSGPAAPVIQKTRLAETALPGRLACRPRRRSVWPARSSATSCAQTSTHSPSILGLVRPWLASARLPRR